MSQFRFSNASLKEGMKILVTGGVEGSPIQNDSMTVVTISVLARRASRRPMDGHFWGKYIQNSLNLLKNLQETCSLDGQLSISG